MTPPRSSVAGTGLAKRAGATADGGPKPPENRRCSVRWLSLKTSPPPNRSPTCSPRRSGISESLTSRENGGHQVEGTNRDLMCEVHHVDGTFNALQRNEQLAWLKSPSPKGNAES